MYLVNSSHELKLMGFRLSGFQAALRQVPGDSSLRACSPGYPGSSCPSDVFSGIQIRVRAVAAPLTDEESL